MKRKPNNVLRSQTGASITFALLLFLACAMVGALVLTAGSAAAGRVSNLAQSDQRYYSVSSAASLLAEELSEKHVKIVQERVVTTEVTTTYKVDVGTGSVVTQIDEPIIAREANYSTTLNDNGTSDDVSPYDPHSDGEGKKLSSDAVGSFLNARAAILLFGNDMLCCNDAAMNASLTKGTEQAGKFVVYHSIAKADGTVENYGDLAVTGEYLVQSDGTMTITLTNDTTAKEHYSLRVKLTPTINENQTDKTTESTRRSYSDSGYTETVTTITTTIKTSEISWTVSGVEKVVS